ncbi:c-type cytochrome [Hyphomicrobium denitrificans]|nr:cytochrome c family protein [Hyphomicrobium denitrificans]
MRIDEIEFIKIAGAILPALLLIFGARTIIDMNVGHAPEKPGFTLPAATEGGAKAEASGGAAPAAAETPDDAAKKVLALLPKASADNGKAIFKKCAACHVAEKGKNPTVGPNLWDVVNRKRASYPGFAYSDAMKAKGGEWSFEELAKFIHSPKTYIPGTKMVFAGLPSESDEADVLAYLATLADTPVPLPK